MMEFNVQFLLFAFAPIFFLFIVWEMRYLKRNAKAFPSATYTVKDTLSNFTLALMHEGADALAALGVMVVYGQFFDARLFDITNSFWSILLLFVLQDFCYYWFHRASHKIRWFWASHVVHHSSETLNFSTAFRQSFTYPVSGMWLFWIPLVALGFQPETVMTVVLINLAFQFFVHTQVCPKLGKLERVFNTPSHHRVHHSKNPEYMDQNYAGVLIIWDRLFGTFVEEKEDVPCEFGITRQVYSHNPVTLTLHEWRDMLKDVGAPDQTWLERLEHFWKGPGWFQIKQRRALRQANRVRAVETPQT